LSDTSHQSWREAYALARQEKDPARIPEMCARARRIIQDRELQLATFGHIHDEEITNCKPRSASCGNSKRKTGNGRVVFRPTHTHPGERPKNGREPEAPSSCSTTHPKEGVKAHRGGFQYANSRMLITR
jgi:hypothetical protein